MSKRIIIVAAIVLVGLSFGGVGVAVADQPDMQECESLNSGKTFSVPEDVADELNANNPQVECAPNPGGGR